MVQTFISQITFAVFEFMCENVIALLNLSSWCLEMVERLFLMVPRGCLQFVIVVFPDHTHLLFLWSPVGKVLTSSLSYMG